MGILSRFKAIMSANLNAAMDKIEDPAKMIDQYLRDLEKDLANVKQETATIMAEEKRSKRELDECTQEIAKMQTYAEKALMAGNEGDARKFLASKQQLDSKRVALEQAYSVAAENAAKMRQMHDKLVADINDLNARRDAIKAKVQVAKTTEKINGMISNVDNSKASKAAFERMEAKANAMLDRANSVTELNASQADASTASLQAKYDSAPSSAVDDELAALKASMGLK